MKQIIIIKNIQMKFFAAAIAAFAYAAIPAETVPDDDKTTVAFADAGDDARSLTAYPGAGIDDDDEDAEEMWYLFTSAEYTGLADGSYDTPPADSDTPEYASEFVMIQYNLTDDDDADASVQNSWNVEYDVTLVDSACATSCASMDEGASLAQLWVSGDSLIADDGEDNLDYATDSSASATMIMTCGDECWSATEDAEVYPGHTTQRAMPDETTGNYVRIEVEGTFNAWYMATTWETSEADATGTTLMAEANTSATGTWAAASSLAAAATVVVAASLF